MKNHCSTVTGSLLRTFHSAAAVISNRVPPQKNPELPGETFAHTTSTSPLWLLFRFPFALTT